MTAPADGQSRRRVLLLGSTGSIGRQALEIVAAVPGLELAGLAADRAADELAEQALQAGVSCVALHDEAAAVRAREFLDGKAIDVLAGEAGIAELIARAAAQAAADEIPLTVLNGIVGAAGLRATMAVLEHGATLALANKESLVAGGELVLAAARRHNAVILPVDSEHSAVLQCLLAARPPRNAVAGASGLGGFLMPAERVILTGSGGPFRGRTRADLAAVTPQQALRHPTWSMGRKITIDSATLMNKGLEVIEAHYLFGVPCEEVEVLISPQSLVHAMVRFADGATIAHLGHPDMRVPIAYALTYPRRAPLATARALDLTAQPLTFERPDMDTFGCLRLAYAAGAAGGGAPVVLNAANEAAVHAFLDGRLGFLDIEAVVADTLAELATTRVGALDEVFALDTAARESAAARIAERRGH